MMGPPVQEIVGQICRRNPRYAPNAHYFVLDALHKRLHVLEAPRHVTGEELAESARQVAMDRFGLLARTVLERHSQEPVAGSPANHEVRNVATRWALPAATSCHREHQKRAKACISDRTHR